MTVTKPLPRRCGWQSVANIQGCSPMAEVEERIARLQQLLATPCEDRDDDTLARTLRNLEQLRAEMALH